MMTEELKSCPFCGGETDVHYFAHDDSECTVMCSNPNCRASVSAKSCGSMTTAYNRARKLWNRRAERTCRIVRGEVTINDYFNGARCSECGHEFETFTNPPNNGPSMSAARYCPHCGAKVVSE